MKDIITKKDSSSSLMSFTKLITKTELVKSLQHFALNVKMYQNVISTQNVVNFKFVDVIYKQKPRKQNSLKSYDILRYKFLRRILSYSSFPLTDIYEMKPV